MDEAQPPTVDPIAGATDDRRTGRRMQVERRPERCWLCGSVTVEIHCKIVCLQCGFRRDCTDP